MTKDFSRFIVTDDFARYAIVPGRASRSPEYMQIELTDRCNLRCQACPRSWTPSTGTVLSPEEFRDLLEQMPLLKHVSFVGLGEVLLLKDFPTYLRMCRERNVFASCNSNGVVVPRRLGPALEAGLGKLAISIDAHDRELLRRLRSGVSRETMEQAFRCAVMLTRQYEARLSAAITVGSANVADLPNLLRFLVELEVPEVTMESLHHWGEDKSLNADSILAADPHAVISAMEEALGIADEAGMAVECFDFYRIWERAHMVGGHCPWPWDSIVVTANGDVTPCCVQLTATDSNRLGNIRQERVTDVWNGTRFTEFRDTFFNGQPWSACEGCLYRAEFGRA